MLIAFVSQVRARESFDFIARLRFELIEPLVGENMNALWRGSIWLLVAIPFFGGCASSTRIEKNESVTIREYGDLYFLAMTKDPRNVEPRAIAEFKSMGFNVKVIDPKNPIEGAQGTAFVISPDGHLLTCSHVLGAEKTATSWSAALRYDTDFVIVDK